MSKEDIIVSSKDPSYQQLFVDIVEIIQSGKSRVAFEVNSTVIILYWSMILPAELPCNTGLLNFMLLG